MIWTIAKRELITRVRSKGFLIITGILFVGIIGVAVALNLLTGDDDARSVTIGLEGEAVALIDVLTVGNEHLAPETVAAQDGRAELEAGEIDVLFDGSTLTWEGSPDNTLDDYMRTIAQQAALGQRAEERGLSRADVGELLRPVEIEEVRLDGGEGESGVRLAAAGVGAMSTFMLLQVWGSFLMMGVIEEKSSKVVEILLSHVRPSTLLAGKVLGLGILAVAQMLIVVAGIVLGLALARGIEVPAGVWGTVPLLLATFLLGFGFYATAFAAVGSTVSRQEDAQSAQLPAMLPLLIGYFIAAASFTTPENPAVTIGSFVPFTSPVLLPFRTALTDIPIWQVAVSLAILALSIYVMLQVAGRIYRYSLLRSGTRVRWAEAWRNRNQVGF